MSMIQLKQFIFQMYTPQSRVPDRFTFMFGIIFSRPNKKQFGYVRLQQYAPDYHLSFSAFQTNIHLQLERVRNRRNVYQSREPLLTNPIFRSRASGLPYSWLFSKYLNSANASFSVFHPEAQCYQAKCPTLYSLGQFFESLNFTNLSNLRISRNLSTSKKPTIRQLRRPTGNQSESCYVKRCTFKKSRAFVNVIIDIRFESVHVQSTGTCTRAYLCC